MKVFNVINWDPNSKEFVPYNVIPYLYDAYKELVENHKKYPKNEYWKVPELYYEFEDFVKKESQYQFWGRCEYEIILVDWPCQKTEKKIDVYEQIMMNLSTVTSILIDQINGN